MRTISPSAALALPDGGFGAVASSPTRDSYTNAETQAASSAGSRPFPDPGAQAFAGQQVEFAVQPGESSAVLRGLVAAQVVRAR